MGNGKEVPQKIKNGKLKIKNGMYDPALLFYKYISRENDNRFYQYMSWCSIGKIYKSGHVRILFMVEGVAPNN